MKIQIKAYHGILELEEIPDSHMPDKIKVLVLRQDESGVAGIEVNKDEFLRAIKAME